MNDPRSIVLASFLVAPVNVEATFSPEKLAERTSHRPAIEAAP
jgi:hypothetical protein